jgi:hypothetical protein
VHDFHMWQLIDGMTITSVHIAVEEGADFTNIVREVRKLLHDYGIHSSSIQPEFVPRTTKVKVRKEGFFVIFRSLQIIVRKIVCLSVKRIGAARNLRIRKRSWKKIFLPPQNCNSFLFINDLCIYNLLCQQSSIDVTIKQFLIFSSFVLQQNVLSTPCLRPNFD